MGFNRGHRNLGIQRNTITPKRDKFGWNMATRAHVLGVELPHHQDVGSMDFFQAMFDTVGLERWSISLAAVVKAAVFIGFYSVGIVVD